MNDFDRLKDKLGKLANEVSDPETGQHGTVSGNQAELLRAILTEIDETILASILSFKNENGQAIAFEVANRRLLCLSDQTTAEILSATELSVGQSISDGDKAANSALEKLLAAFLKTSASLKVGSTKLTRDVDPSEIGCSTDNLAKHWSVSLSFHQITRPDKMLNALLDACADFATAWLKLTATEISASGGETAALARLIALAQATPDGLDKALKQPLDLADAPRCVVLSMDSIGGHAIIHASSGNDRLFLALPADRAIEAATNWQRLQIL